MSKLARTFSAAVLVALTLMASASTAGAAVTLGQLAPVSTSLGNCANDDPFDALQPTVTSGNSYVVPATPPSWVVTSWSHNASSDLGQMLTLKFFRHVSGVTYSVVGHDGPRPITASTGNTFSGLGIPVRAGDVLGLNDGPPSGCAFTVSGDSVLEQFGDLADGASTNFNTRNDVRLNITALLEPDCDSDGLGDETQDTNLSTCAAPGPGSTSVFCKGKPATIVGTAGSDVRTGSRGRDVIVGLGGNDRLSGVAGNDLICGGKGKDNLSGGKGKDKLYGQKGKDKLRGKAGKDLCVGGPGKDKAKGCEKTKSI